MTASEAKKLSKVRAKELRLTRITVGKQSVMKEIEAAVRQGKSTTRVIYFDVAVEQYLRDLGYRIELCPGVEYMWVSW